MKLPKMPSTKTLERFGKKDAAIGLTPRLGIPAYRKAYSPTYVKFLAENCKVAQPF